jgi:predicted NUDIX family NTP pyrophosphohydrolase
VKGDFRELTPLDQPSRKTVYAWAVEGACDERNIKSNTFTIEWPPKSGRQRKFPEIDRAGWFTISRAKEKMLKGQVAFLGQLLSLLGQKASPDRTDGDEGITDEHGQQSLF